MIDERRSPLVACARRTRGATALVAVLLVALAAGAQQTGVETDGAAEATATADAEVDASPESHAVAPGDDTPDPATAREREADVYRVIDVPVPDGVELEVGGLLPLGDDALLVATRRGHLWRVDDAYGAAPTFSLWADGLAEPLGLLAHDGWVYTAQRGELSRLRDADGDGRADLFETVCDDWELSGSYHEYAFGPVLDRDGRLWVTLNIPFDDEPFGRVDWRGWAVRIDEDGTMTPVVAGLRSPAGLGVAPSGEVFYTDNQGEWCGASKLSVLREGEFHGHPHGLFSCEDPRARVAHPGEVPDGELFPDVARRLPSLRLPAVWFPYDEMGRSPSGFAWDETEGAFGPFAGQLFVGDQYQASVSRVFLERVDDTWQGACFPFRRGLGSGVIRVTFGADGGLWVGLSDRGWPSLGADTQGLQRLVWTGNVPFEIRAMRARARGFQLELTAPVDVATARSPTAYTLRSYTYELHSDYGSDELDERELPVSAISVSDDGYLVELAVDGLREGYVHELVAEGLRAADGRALLHAQAYYTLQRVPRD